MITGNKIAVQEAPPITSNTRSLKILMVAARYFPFIGGVETHVYEVAWRLAKVGMQVTVLTTDTSEQLPALEMSRGVEIIRVPAWPADKDYYFAPAIYRAIAQRKWDIIHCQGYHTLVPPMAMLAAQRANIPYVVTFHSGGDSSLFRKAIRGAQRVALSPLLAKAERLIGPSKWEADFFRERLHLSSEQFSVIPNGAHHLPAVAEATRKKGVGPLIVSVGRLEKYKGHQRVIAALPKVLAHIPDVRLRIVGKGPYEAELRKLVSELGLAEHVEIAAAPPGDSEGMAAIMAQADLVTLLSEHEGQGIAVLEALSLQRPVLVANATALQEFAELGLALAVPLKCSPEEVATAIVRQLRDPLIPASITLPTWDDCAAELLELYQSIVERRSACAS